MSKTAEQVVADVIARKRAERQRPIVEGSAGAAKLEELLRILSDQPALWQRRVVWDMSPSGQERAVVFSTGDAEIARWTRKGQTLSFSATGEVTDDVLEALAITTEFLFDRGYLG